MLAPTPLTRRQVLQTASVLGISKYLLANPTTPWELRRPVRTSPAIGARLKQMKILKYDEIPDS
jgi:hypothetical protein